MASYTLHSHGFAPGTSVSAYPADALPGTASVPSGSPVSTATVGSDGSLTFTALASGERYAAFANGRAVRFVAPDSWLELERPAKRRDVSSVEGAATVIQAGNLGAAYALDMAGHHDVLVVGTLTANCVVSIMNMAAGAACAFELHQDASGGHAVTFPSAILPSGALVVGGAANAATVVSFYSPDGSTLVGLSSAASAAVDVTQAGTDVVVGANGRLVTPIARAQKFTASPGATAVTFNPGQTGVTAAAVSGHGQPRDVAGALDITFPASPAPVAGHFVTVNFTTFVARPAVTLTPANQAAVDAGLYLGQVFTSSFQIFGRNAPAASAVVSVHYHVIGLSDT